MTLGNGDTTSKCIASIAQQAKLQMAIVTVRPDENRSISDILRKCAFLTSDWMEIRKEEETTVA